MQNSIFATKIKRLSEGKPPRVLDLFSGTGGMSLGFHRAGFALIESVEFDALAAASHALNFHPPAAGESSPHPASLSRDITKIAALDLLAHKTGAAAEAIDVIIGGPPCQAFARVGRAKLREIQQHPDAYLRDPRAQLYLSYMEYVRVLQPVAVLVENVPDVINHGGLNVAHEISQTLSELGYNCGYTLLNCVHYGVPQMRERMFLIALTQELGQEVKFPLPTHSWTLPKGYAGTRRTVLNSLEKLADGNSYFVATPRAEHDLPAAVTAAEALADLPLLSAHLEGAMPRGARRFDQMLPYRSDRQPTAYGQLMRSWPGFSSDGGIADHVIRSLPRDYRIFRAMQAGDQYPEAVAVARKLLSAEMRRLKIRSNSPDHKALIRAFIPPYDPGKFPNKWRKMALNEPARTLMAHLGKDSYTHIHYDSKQARTISVREAARLQSFPDGFKFVGTMNPAFKQIGNAVPPLMAFALADSIMQSLRNGAIQAKRP